MEISAIINYVIYGILALLLISGFLIGMRRGVCRQTVRFATVIISALVSFLIFGGFFPKMLAYLEGRSLYDFISGTVAPFGVAIPEWLAGWLGCFESKTGAYMLAIPAAVIVMPIFFVLVYLVLSGLLAIPYVILSGVFGFTKKNNNGLTRILGGAVGLVQGFIISAIILLPFSGALGIADNAVRAAEEKHPESVNTVVLGGAYHKNLEPIKNNVAVKCSDFCLGFMYDAISTIEVEGEDVSMDTVVSDAMNILVLYGDLAGMDKDAIGDEYKAVIDELVSTLGEDKYMAELIAGVMRGAANAREKGILKINSTDDHIGAFTDEFFTLFATSDYQNVKSDITTFKQFFFVLSDAGTLKAAKKSPEDMFASLLETDENGDTTVKKVCFVLESNPRTAHMATTLNVMAMDILLSNVTDNPDTAATIASVKESLNTVVAMNREDYATEEEYKAAVSGEINKTLTENQIALEEEQLEEVTNFVITEFEDVDEITDAHLAGFMAEYYNAKATASAEQAPAPEQTPAPDGSATPEPTPGSTLGSI